MGRKLKLLNKIMPSSSFRYLSFSFFDVKNIWNRLVQRREEVIWVIIGQLLAFAGGFVGLKILTNYMGPHSYGQLALGLTMAGLLNQFFYGPISQVVSRFFSVYRERRELSVYFNIIKKAHLHLGLILLFGTIFVSVLIKVIVGKDWALLVLMGLLYGVVSGANGSFLSLQNTIRQRKVAALHMGVEPWLRTGLAVLAIYLFTNSGYSAIFGYLVGTFFIVISQWGFALKNDEILLNWNGYDFDETLKGKRSKELYAYAFSFILFAVFGAVSMYSDRWILQFYLSEREVGIYFAIYQIANAPLLLIGNMTNQFTFPIIFDRAGAMTSAGQAENAARVLRKTILISSILMLIVVAVFFVWGELLMRILTSTLFAEYHNLLWIVMLGLFLFNIAQQYCMKGLFFNQPEIYFWPKAIHACSFIIFMPLLTKSYGLFGMSISICISSLIYIFTIFVVNRTLKIYIGLEEK